jgi:excisionase family DNA binding protein
MSEKCYISSDNLSLTLTELEAAEVLCIGRNTAYKIAQSGDLPSRRIGKHGQIRVLKCNLI